jgi:hypothetical protein
MLPTPIKFDITDLFRASEEYHHRPEIIVVLGEPGDVAFLPQER